MDIRASALFLALALASCSNTEFPEASTNLEESLRLAQITRSSGGISSAVMQLRQLALDHPGSSDVYLALGNALFDSRSYSEAEDAFTKAGQLNSSIETPEIGLGRINLARHLPGKALEHFAAALRLKPGSGAALNGSGVANDMLGNPILAQRFYREALAAQPHDRMARSNLGLSLALDGRTREAIVMLSEMAQQADMPSIVRQNLALAYALAGDRKAASDLAAMDLDPKQVEENLAFYTLIRDSRIAAQASATAKRGTGPSGNPQPPTLASPPPPPPLPPVPMPMSAPVKPKVVP